MRITSWLRKLQSRLTRAVGAGRRVAPSRPPVRYRPRLEPLEDRLVLAFSAPADYAVGPWNSNFGSPSEQIMLTADFNLDGRPDLARINNGDNTVSVLLGNGLGTFAPKIDSSTGTNLGNVIWTDGSVAGGSPTAVAAGDFNGDGITDLVTANGRGENLSLLYGTGTGAFLPPLGIPLPPQGLFTGEYQATDVAVAHLNGDRHADLVVSSQFYYSGSGMVYRVYGYLGDGTGRFTVLTLTGASGYLSPVIETGDLNADDKVDLVTADSDGSVAAYLGVGDGTFTFAQRVYTGASNYNVTVVDLNADGKLDLATPRVVLLGNGDGTFQPYRSYNSGVNPFVVAAGDFNRDGIVDLLTGNAGDSYSVGPSVSVNLGKGDGTFRPALESSLPGTPLSLAVADFNGDGFSDVATATYPDVATTPYPDRVWVLINDRTWPPPQPAIRISDVAKKEGSQGKVAFIFTVTLSYASTQTITLNYATADGTTLYGNAKAGEDYQAASGMLIFNPGETTKTITVWVLGDKRGEADETFYLDLSGVVNADLEDGRGIGTIRDDDNHGW